MQTTRHRSLFPPLDSLTQSLPTRPRTFARSLASTTGWVTRRSWRFRAHTRLAAPLRSARERSTTGMASRVRPSTHAPRTALPGRRVPRTEWQGASRGLRCGFVSTTRTSRYPGRRTQSASPSRPISCSRRTLASSPSLTSTLRLRLPSSQTMPPRTRSSLSSAPSSIRQAGSRSETDGIRHIAPYSVTHYSINGKLLSSESTD
mmetsp:Transcript_11186/g.29135  ORF Transcript_11186/g.29135 Transcript_11186/m.29135 type:complete len:204 (+) Transcript_11186:489-1100(+)